MSLFEVNTQTCRQDGICAAVCPGGLILMKEGGYPEAVAEASEVCIGCGHCVAICPTGSLSHRVMSAAECPSIQKELKVSPARCEQFLRARRSIRTYKEQPVSQEKLLRLIELARYAPTGHNSQTVEWLVLGRQDEQKRLAGITIDWMRWMLVNQPERAAAMNLQRTIRRWEGGTDVIFRHAPALILTHAPESDLMAPTSSTLALSYLELAATSMGLGCCWAGYFRAAATIFPPMKEGLPLPQGHHCLGAMMVGYPLYQYHRLPLRKTPKVLWRL